MVSSFSSISKDEKTPAINLVCHNLSAKTMFLYEFVQTQASLNS